jgi:signal transduction histidine kinase
VEVSFAADKALQNICVDPKGIRRCILNLVTNAVDACLEGGGDVEVRTFAAEEDGMVRIVVRDTGCGMSEETLAKLFTIFFSTKGSKGTGLGLPVTKKIVEEHGGRIKAESRQGAGTTFTVSLPATRLQRPRKGASHAGGSQEDTDSG